MQEAMKEMSHHPKYDYIVINDQLDQAIEDMCSIILATRMKKRIKLKNINILLKSCWKNKFYQVK